MIGPSLRIVFFGTPAFAVPTLEALLASPHSVVGVVTQPDRPRGRGQHTTDAPVKTRALQDGLAILQPTTLKTPELLAALSALKGDLGVVAAYGRILPEAVLTAVPLGMINVHASLLPKYRGAAPVHRAVMAGEPETGVTIMRVVKALDAGPMLATARRSISEDETSVEVEQDLANLGARLLVETLDRLAAGASTEQPQDEASATYAARLTKEDSPIGWARSARQVHNQIRGLHPWPLAHTYLDGQRLIVRRSAIGSEVADAAPGTIMKAAGDDLEVATGAGLLRIVELQAEGRRPMRVREFLAGHHLKPGRQLAGPP